MSSCLTLTLSSGGSEDWIGAKVSRTEPFATNGSTARTFAWNAAIVGRVKRGEATSLERSQMTAQPSAMARPNQPNARPRRPLALAKPVRETAEAMHRNASHDAATRKREPCRNSTPEADDEPNRKLGTLRLEQLLQLLVKRGKPRPPIAPSTLWKRRFPYVRGARPLHCSIKRRGKCA